MSLSSLIKLVILGAALYSGVQYAKVYIHKTQLAKALGDEALDARRDRGTSADGLERNVLARINADATELPEDIEFLVEGLGDPEDDVVVTATYTEVVNLIVWKHRMKMSVEARADAP